jgi:hypothetical protein
VIVGVRAERMGQLIKSDEYFIVDEGRGNS